MDNRTETNPDRGGITRRIFLAEGTRLTALGGLGAMLGALGLPRAAAAQEWTELSRVRPAGGFGIVKELWTEASAAGRPLRKGSRVESGEEIRVPRGNLMTLSLSDNTILRINGGTTVTLEIGADRRGFFRLLVGSILTVMPTRNFYLAYLPTAVIGIKGTVFFQQIFHPGETTARGMNNKPFAIPGGVREYFCLCNGAVDFLNTGDLGAFFTDKAEHHNSYFIDPSRPEKLVKAPMVNHDDSEIRYLIYLQDGPKHSSKFLDDYEENY